MEDGIHLPAEHPVQFCNHLVDAVFVDELIWIIAFEYFGNKGRYTLASDLIALLCGHQFGFGHDLVEQRGVAQCFARPFSGEGSAG